MFNDIQNFIQKNPTATSATPIMLDYLLIKFLYSMLYIYISGTSEKIKN